MSTEAVRGGASWSRFEQLRYGREVVRVEGQTLLALADRLNDDFARAVELIHACSGAVLVIGMGKAGLVGQKIAATLASTGTRSHFLHAGEAVHGDLGRVHRDDVVLVLSFSGETEEVTRLLPSLRAFGTPIIAVTGHPHSQLGRAATVTLDLGPIREACALGLAPTASTAAMMAVGDALALVVSQQREFGPADFARFHPGGSLGRKLAKVDDVMRPLADCRVAPDHSTVRQVFIQAGRPGRRTGAVMLVDPNGHLSGLFTDSDLARLLERKQDAAIDRPVREVMTRTPRTVVRGAPVADAIAILAGRKLSELPVIDDEGHPVGLVDVTDLVGWLPHDPTASPVSSEPIAQESAPATISMTNRRPRRG